MIGGKEVYNGILLDPRFKIACEAAVVGREPEPEKTCITCGTECPAREAGVNLWCNFWSRRQSVLEVVESDVSAHA